MTEATVPQTWTFHDFPLGVLDVYPPAYLLPSEDVSFLKKHGVEAYAQKISEGEDKGEFRAVLYNEENPTDAPVFLKNGQSISIEGYGKFSVVEDAKA
jgi:hypothetical protein